MNLILTETCGTHYTLLLNTETKDEEAMDRNADYLTVENSEELHPEEISSEEFKEDLQRQKRGRDHVWIR